ncbi:NAD(P)-binding domain-containing protein, partial [Cronobacter sakazakii]|uniref:NAD(P)-binding domain-containing protein n=1 Tax=Cronobacter sakazakii TaxID=28141 RepID=UPI001EFCB3CF
MAENRVNAGVTVTVWSRSPETAEALRASGAQVAKSKKDTHSADVLVTILADDTVTADVAVEQGKAASLEPGALWID